MKRALPYLAWLALLPALSTQASHYPLSVQSCNRQVTFEQAEGK